MKMGSYEAKGTGVSKKIARTLAAQMMYNTIPEEWKNLDSPARKGKKRKSVASTRAAEPAAKIAAKNPVTTTTTAAAAATTTPEAPAAKPLSLFATPAPRAANARSKGRGGRPEKAAESAAPRPVSQVVSSTNPISAIFEYCKKGENFSFKLSRPSMYNDFY